jgi:hypothetical protein
MAFDVISSCSDLSRQRFDGCHVLAKTLHQDIVVIGVGNFEQGLVPGGAGLGS